MRDYPNELRGRIIAARSNALPLTPALYQELLQLEERLPIEPYAGVIGQPKPPAAPSKPDGATSSAVQETESQQTNGGMQFTNKPYMYTLVAFCVAFGVGYLYLPGFLVVTAGLLAFYASVAAFINFGVRMVSAIQVSTTPTHDIPLTCRSIILFFSYYLFITLLCIHVRLPLRSAGPYTHIHHHEPDDPKANLLSDSSIFPILLVVFGISGYQVQQKRDKLPLLMANTSDSLVAQPIVE
ncbi:hypothetical protein cyc_08563 [Cyclospora cayetanensis]|uniref:Transmembrane protein n=1 Tax=Cyclospora cayetanensis TaxID=88456 RepID=A0A1D3D6P9_9EIME|nr:hypothetical protein cyc_08563 [Cyclospora cayetanensis]